MQSTIQPNARSDVFEVARSSVSHPIEPAHRLRVGFLFNHDQLHQIAHALPVALALQRRAERVEVIVATTHGRLSAEVQRLANLAGGVINVTQLDLTRPGSRFAESVLEWLAPARKLCIYRDNLAFFKTLDALVVAEKTSLVLKTRYGLNKLKIIHTRHGAGDRAVGFDRASARFDHILVSGPKIRGRLIADAGVSPEQLATVGYPKFDLMPAAAPALSFADPTKPTVLYNPHPSPHLSSWYRHGRQVLEHFLRDDRYNLIFAPHVMLFHRRIAVSVDRLRVGCPGAIGDRYRNAPNIHVDLGSPASTDMSYTMAADLYLGDVSSQVYEFLYRPRPCLFLNSHNVDWRDDANYRHWDAGEVLNAPEALSEALDRAWSQHAFYLPRQQRLFEGSFDITAESSAERAARAIEQALEPTDRFPPSPNLAPSDLRGPAVAATPALVD